MNEKTIRTAIGRHVHIEAGIERAEGTLTHATPVRTNFGGWGAVGGLNVANGDWELTIDGHTREWSSTAELTILD